MNSRLKSARDPPQDPRIVVDHLSHSAIRTFLACPQRFAYRYILGIPEAVTSSSLVFGKALHAAVEAYYQGLLEGQSPAHLDLLLDAFWTAWHSDEKSIHFGAGEDVSTIGRTADRVLRAFLASALARPGGTILGVEEEVRGVVVDGVPEFVGRLDILLDAGDELVVIDLKSSRTRWGAAKVTDAAPQLLLYSELARPLAEGRPVRLAFAVITKTRQPSVTLQPVSARPERVEELRRMIAQVWRAIRAGAFYPNPSLLNCPGCPFRGRPCRAWAA